MIRPEASPLLAPVRIALPPTGAPLEAVGELYAWLGAHNIDATHGPFDRRRGALISRSSLTMWLDAGGPDVSRTLTSHPSLIMLISLARAGALFCTATHRRDAALLGDDGQLQRRETVELWECNVPVDSRGRHTGCHADGRYGDGAWWDNDDSATAELPITERLQPADPDWPSRLVTDDAPSITADYTGPWPPAPPLTVADLQATIDRLTGPAPREVWQYTPPAGMPPGLGAGLPTPDLS